MHAFIRVLLNSLNTLSISFIICHSEHFTKMIDMYTQDKTLQKFIKIIFNESEAKQINFDVLNAETNFKRSQIKEHFVNYCRNFVALVIFS